MATACNAKWLWRCSPAKARSAECRIPAKVAQVGQTSSRLRVVALARQPRSVPPDMCGCAGECSRSIVLLLFLQKQNLATAIYLFGLGTLLTGLGLKHKSELYLQSFLTVDNRHPPKTRGTHRGLDTWTCPKSCVFQVIYSVQHRRQNDGVHGTKVHCGLKTTIQHDSLHQKRGCVVYWYSI